MNCHYFVLIFCYQSTDPFFILIYKTSLYTNAVVLPHHSPVLIIIPYSKPADQHRRAAPNSVHRRPLSPTRTAPSQRAQPICSSGISVLLCHLRVRLIIWQQHQLQQVVPSALPRPTCTARPACLPGRPPFSQPASTSVLPRHPSRVPANATEFQSRLPEGLNMLLEVVRTEDGTHAQAVATVVFKKLDPSGQLMVRVMRYKLTSYVRDIIS